MPSSVSDALHERGVDVEHLLYCVKADLNKEGHYVDVHMTFDQGALYILQGYDTVAQDYFQVVDYEEIDIKNIEDLYIDRQIHTARLIVREENREYEIARFSLGKSEQFEQFKDRLLKTKNNEPIDDTDLKNREEFCPKCHNRYPNRERKVCPNCLDKGSTFKRLLGMYMRYKKEFIFVMAMITASTLFNLITPYFSAQLLYDEVLTKGGSWYGKVTAIVLLIAGIRFIGIVLSAIYGIVLARMTPKITRDIKVEIFSKLQTLPVGFFSSKQTGSLMARVDQDATNIYWFFVDVVPYAIVSIVTIIGLLGLMLFINVWITIVMFTGVMITVVILKRFRKKQRKLHRRKHHAVRATNALISDSLNGQRVVKAFAKEDQEIGRYTIKNQEFYDVSLHLGERSANMFPYVRMISRASDTAVLAIGAFSILYGNLTLGSLYALFSYTSMIQNSITFLANMGDRWARCIDAASRMFEILDTFPSLREAAEPIQRDVLEGDIVLDNVSFEYEVGRPILKHISFNIEKGQMFGIVGKTGAGKSTLIHLMSRLYDTTEGTITIDGVPIKQLSFESLRKNIGIVSQETYLFIGSIAENIKYAKPDATMEEVIFAAKAAYAHDFIMKHAEGYDTIIGSGGVNLSGGEKQRLSIARAILQKPSILILDEATAAMDTQTERKIQEAIENLKEGRTIIAIAHRLSTLRDADKLAVIENGELFEMGTHEELIEKQGKYYELHKLQTEAIKFIEEG